MRSANVLIIGGGVIAASVAWHLASRGCRDILVIDRGPRPGDGEGSTSKATGGFRAQFASDINVRLSLLSREKLRRFPEEIGVDSGYRPYGYLFLAGDERQLASLRDAITIQHAAGLGEVAEISRLEAATLNPAVSIERVVGGAFCPTDGFIRAMNILRGYIDQATRLGVTFEYGTEASGFETSSRHVVSVLTSRGRVQAHHIVNAAGAWAGLLARAAGVELPVRPLRRQVAITHPTGLLPESMPMTVFLEDGFHLRMRDGRALLLWPDDPQTLDPFDTAFSDRWLDEVRRRALERVPRLAEVAVDRQACWAGLYEMSPDRHLILGRSGQLENFYCANGSSGHGVMHAPAVGHLLAEIILDGEATTLDVSALRPSRFAEGKMIDSVSLL